MADVINNHNLLSENLYSQISQSLKEATSRIVTTVNTAMIHAYWHIDKLIFDAQGDGAKAKYGNEFINDISRRFCVV